MQQRQSSHASASDAPRSANPELCRYITGDACSLGSASLPFSSYDVVVDKALFDALLCHDDAQARAGSLMQGVHALLGVGQRYLMVSCAHPGLRKPFFVDNSVSLLSPGVTSMPAFAWDVQAPEKVFSEDFSGSSGVGGQAYGRGDAHNHVVKEDDATFVYVLAKKIPQ
jgi:hypothetical protein